MMFGHRRKEPKVEEPEYEFPTDEESHEMAASDRKHDERIAKFQAEERKKETQGYMAIWMPWKAAFHARARLARADRLTRFQK